ncbi:MAG: PUA domain-containing protein [Nitrososphaerota archaeon]
MLDVVRAISNYQFGTDVGEQLFPDGTVIEVSKRTGKPKRIYLDGKLLATVRSNDGFIVLTVEGAMRLRALLPPGRFRVIASDDAVRFIVEGKSLFSKHVLEADPKILPGEEVIIENDKGELLAVGKAVISGCEMGKFRRGLAVKVRKVRGGTL